MREQKPLQNVYIIENNVMQLITDSHFKLETAKDFVFKGLNKYISSHEKIERVIARYSPEVILETGGQLQTAFKKPKTKAVNIPSIKPYTSGDFTIEDASLSDYPFISPLMGMIVRCCAYPCGSGLTLCKATAISPWFKIMLVKKGQEVQGLTVVCCDVSKKTLAILGFETDAHNLSQKKTGHFRDLIYYSAKEMLENSNYENVLFSCGGKGLLNIGVILEKEKINLMEIKTYEELTSLARRSNLPIFSTEQENFSIEDGEEWGFDTLKDIPETAVCIEIARKKI